MAMAHTDDTKETLQDILTKVQQDEISAAEKSTKTWLHEKFADNVSKSLQSLNSSDNSDKSSHKSDNETTYWDIDALASVIGPAPLLVETDPDPKKSPTMHRPQANGAGNPRAIAIDTKTNKTKSASKGVDNPAFERDIPEDKSLANHGTGSVNSSTSIPVDYDMDNPTSPVPDYGKSVRPIFSFERLPAPKKPRFGVSVFPDRSEVIPLNTISQHTVQFNTETADLERDYTSSFDPLGINDLSKLSELTLDTITDCLQERFSRDKIYTYCGEILLSVNPYKPLDICTYQYHGKYTPSDISKEPHLFAISAKAYSAIRDLHHNQVILVSGESGAGKTEATKYMVQHLMAIGGSEYDNLQNKIIKINPLLEAFGNAKTILNNNSSRFAKFLSLAVNEAGKIESARVKDYMLEKSRVVHHSSKEHTFHAFYALLVGASDEILESLFINRKDSFRITGQFYSLNGKEKELYKIIYQEQQDVFQLINLTAEEIQDVNNILAAILHLGNVEFLDSDNDSVIIKNETVVQQAAFLLEIDVEKMARVLIERKGRLGKDRQVVFPAFFSQSDAGSSFLSTPSRGGIYPVDNLVATNLSRSSEDETDAGEIIELSKSKKQAEDERDAIAKSLYERMFGWLVRKINDSLKATKLRDLPSIGILDICGFENLETNSFEQLCINIVNEQLQNFMNKKVIEEERQLYIDENVEIKDIDISGINNDAILSMFMEKRGILAMIDEDSKLEFSDDMKLVSKLKSMFEKNPHFEPSINKSAEFGIKHFAGKVSYNILSFIKKNRDTLSEDTFECLKSSESTLIQDLFTVTESYTGSISMSPFTFRGSRKPNIKHHVVTDTNFSESINQSRKASLKIKFGDKAPSLKSVDKARRQTHITFFNNSLKELLDAMRGADPYFVRCIKPNEKQKPNEFVEEQVRKQLQYNGVKEAARIRTFGFGFPIRMPRKDFELKFKDLVKSPTGNQLAEDIFHSLQADTAFYKMGKTQIFMKENIKSSLEKALSELRLQQEQERLRKLERERIEREKQERQRRELLLKEKSEMDRRKAMGFDCIDGNNALDTIVEVQTPASHVSDSVYRSFSSTDTFITNVDEEDGSSSETIPKSLVNEEAVPKVKQNAAWDISQELTEEVEKKDVHEQPVLMVIKFIVYIALLVILFGSLTLHKISLMISVKNLNIDINEEIKTQPQKRNLSIVFLVIAMCIPHGLWWIITVLKLCFGNFKPPSLWTWIWVFIMENLQTIGMCLLVFRILPQLDAIRGLMLLSGTAIVPSILKFCMSDGDIHVAQVTCLKYKSARSAFKMMVDFFVMLMQISVIPLCIILNFQQQGQSPKKIVETLFAFLLISCNQWENFVDGRLFCELSYNNCFKNAVLKMRYELQKGRHYPHLVSLPFKIGITIWLGFQLTGADLDYIKTFEYLQHPKFTFPELHLSSIITLCISSFVAFYLAFGACMFQMQIPSLTIPLTFATPAAIAIFAANSKHEFLNAVSYTNMQVLDIDSFIVSWYHILYGVIWWVSLLLLTRHTWRPQADRTANMERLFINPSYCGILTTENIMLNRRRHPKPVDVDVKLDDKGEIIGTFYKIKNKKNKGLNEEEIGSDIDESDEESNQSAQSSQPFADNADSDRLNDRLRTAPMLYACATMWHETRTEMIQLLKSLHRLDRDQYIRRLAYDKVKSFDPDFYNFEAHIFFDDAMELDDDDQQVPNRWVKDLVSCMDVACSSVHGKPMKVHPPIKVPTPYGGQLIWQMPGENLLFVHMKDVSKIRNRKRWSQVMYMYYLLGYRHIMTCKNDLLEKMRQIDLKRGGFGLNIHEINYLLGENAAYRSHNTFLLALDGDTDFSPGAVKILLDRMRDNNVGAACGRIHPIGNGPMIWYQKFEYAIGHWLQKSAEHVFGCVLCSPGCFSLFRAAALMDTNVMKKYTTEPTEPTHHLQFDQGEDRWLCTLLLQQGYRIEYAAAADAWTFAPEGFFEFFNQRRRWMPSTIANILDLLGTATLTTKKNANMSFLYICYQWLLMLMTILGPGTILMMIAGAAKLVFELSNVNAYIFATVPAAIFTVSCFWLQSKYQLIFAAVLSIMYTFIMMIVFVGTIITISENNLFHPSVIVIVLLVGIFLIAGICHPQEIWCLMHGILYLLTIPSGYLLLVIYSICNLNDVSWGTREVPTKAQRLEMEKKKKEKEEQKKNKQNKGFLARIFNRGEEHLKEVTKLVKTLIPERNNQVQMNFNGENDQSVVELLSKIENNLKVLIEKSDAQSGLKSCAHETQVSLTNIIVEQPTAREPETHKLAASVKLAKDLSSTEKPAETKKASQPLHSILKNRQITNGKKEKKKVRDELRNPFWSEDKGLGSGQIIEANEKELQFWKEFVTKYLLPIKPSPEEKKKIEDGLRELRNSSAFALIIVNLLWMALNFMFQEKQVAKISFTYDITGKGKMEESALGYMFVGLLLILLILQMIGMLIHRMGTLQHLLAITEIKIRKGKKKSGANEKQDRDNIIKHIKEVLKIPSAYDESETVPPQIAEKDNFHGMSVVGTSMKGSLGMSHQDEELTNQLGMTIKSVGPMLQAEKMSGNSRSSFNKDTMETLKSVRERLISGSIDKKLGHGLGKSLRPKLPPRNKTTSPTLLQTTKNWGFTVDELSSAQLQEFQPISSDTLPNNFRHLGTMGRSLIHRTRTINEVTSEIRQNPNSLKLDLKWSNSDVVKSRKPSYKRHNNHSNFVRL